jgi:hypothetical protein
MRIALKQRYGEDVVVLYLNGASGDINYVDYINGSDSGGRNNRTIGNALGAAVLRLNYSIVADEEYPVIAVNSATIEMPLRHPTEAQLQWGREMKLKWDNGGSLSESEKNYVLNLLEYSANPETMEKTYSIELHTLCLGEFAMVSLPYELYSHIGWGIKEVSPYENTLIVSLANGYFGYAGPDFIYGTSSYGAIYSYHTHRADKGSADLMINNSKKLLAEMREETHGE